MVGKQYLLAVRQQATTYSNVDQDLCRHMALLAHNEFRLLRVGTFISTDAPFISSCSLSGNLAYFDYDHPAQI